MNNALATAKSNARAARNDEALRLIRRLADGDELTVASVQVGTLAYLPALRALAEYMGISSRGAATELLHRINAAAGVR